MIEFTEEMAAKASARGWQDIGNLETNGAQDAWIWAWRVRTTQDGFSVTITLDSGRWLIDSESAFLMLEATDHELRIRTLEWAVARLRSHVGAP